jgi:hypothetical protein
MAACSIRVSACLKADSTTAESGLNSRVHSHDPSFWVALPPTWQAEIGSARHGGDTRHDALD